MPGPKIEPQASLPPPFSYVELEHVERAVNAYRYYRLARHVDLFGQSGLLRVWGRKGQFKCVQLLPFLDWPAAWPTARRLLRTRLRHGYVVVAGRLPVVPDGLFT